MFCIIVVGISMFCHSLSGFKDTLFEWHDTTPFGGIAERFVPSLWEITEVILPSFQFPCAIRQVKEAFKSEFFGYLFGVFQYFIKEAATVGNNSATRIQEIVHGKMLFCLLVVGIAAKVFIMYELPLILTKSNL